MMAWEWEARTPRLNPQFSTNPTCTQALCFFDSEVATVHCPTVPDAVTAYLEEFLDEGTALEELGVFHTHN